MLIALRAVNGGEALPNAWQLRVRHEAVRVGCFGFHSNLMRGVLVGATE
jgi:hypothetical protein